MQLWKKYEKFSKKVLTKHALRVIIYIESEVREWQRKRKKVIRLLTPPLSLHLSN